MPHLTAPAEPNRRILVVDDNPNIHDDIRKVFQGMSSTAAVAEQLGADLFGEKSAEVGFAFTIDSAYQGQEGLASVQRARDEGRPYALAFIDMRMPPGWDGLETISRVWDADPELQIVVCTAYSDYSWAAMVQKLGHSEGLLVLKKPFDNIEVKQIAHALSEKWNLRRDVQGRLRDLEGLVKERMRDVEQTNARLREEMKEKERLQLELRTAERLASVGTLAAGVAHEINNPLTFVLTNLTFLEEDVRRLPHEATPEVIDRLERSLADARLGAERVRDIVRDMKVLSRPDEGRTAAVDLQHLLEVSINLTWNEIRLHARLEKDFAKVPSVEANESRLGQVFINLLVNAVQAIPAGHVADNLIRISLREAAGRVIVEVSDTGSGIPPELSLRVFDPFFTTKEPGVGTGLGLAICHSIVTRAGGEIRLRSEVGKGTTFTVDLPASVARPATETLPAPAAAPKRSARVLMIDDEPVMCLLVQQALQPLHVVVAVTRAPEALDRIARGEAFDVILCDLMMPEMNGQALHAEMARRWPELASKMIFLTGGAFTSSARTFLDSISNTAVDKPIDIRALRELVAQRVAGAAPLVKSLDG